MTSLKTVNGTVETNIGRADRGRKFDPERLRDAIAEYIGGTARAGETTIRQVSCPPFAAWGQGLLPEPTRIRLGNPGVYSTTRAAAEGEFRRVQGTMLLPPAVRAALVALGVKYSVWFPPADPPTNVLQVKMIAGRSGQDQPDAFACCLAPENTKFNGPPIAKVIPGKLEVVKQDEAVLITGMAIGEICPFGLSQSVAYCIDPTVLKLSEVAMSAGTPETMLVMSSGELTKLPGALSVPGLALPM